MEMSTLEDAIILLVSGGLIALYGFGRLFARLGEQESERDKSMKMVIVIGLLVVGAGLVQLVRHLMQ